MRITSIESDGIGPLPRVRWQPSNCEVIYDDNQQGKTTLIDLLIQSVFKEGRKQLFHDEDRYEELPETKVTVQFSDDELVFESGATNPALSNVLDWNFAELHRFLCIRASEVDVSGPRNRSDIWQSLASVIGGMDDDHLEQVKDTIRDEAKLTKSGRWVNRKPDYFLKRIREEIVPTLNDIDSAESEIRSLVQTQNDLGELKDQRASLDEKIENEIDAEIDKIQRKIERKKIMNAQKKVDEAVEVKTELQRDYGRIDPSFEEEWRGAQNSLSNIEEKIRVKTDERNEVEEQLNERKQKLDELRNQRTEFEEEEEQLRKEIEQRKQELEELRDEVTSRKTSLRTTIDEIQETRERFKTWEDWWDGCKFGAPVLIVMGALLGYIVGSSVLTYSLLALSILIILGSGTVLYRKSKSQAHLEEQRSYLKDEYGDWLDDTADQKPLEQAKNILDKQVPDLFPEVSEGVDEVDRRLQQVLQEKSAVDARMDELEEKVDELEERQDTLDDQINELEDKLGNTRDTCEEFRQKTGVPDFNTYEERLEERKQLDSKLQSLIDKLSVMLEMDEGDPELSTLEAEVQNRVSNLDDIDEPVKTLDDLERHREQLTEEKQDLKKERKECQKKIDEKKSVIDEHSSSLYELGIDLDQPEELFRKKNQLEQELKNAVKDRMAANLVLKMINNLEGDYLDQVRDLLDEDGRDRPSLNEMYRQVMGQQYSVQFDQDDFSFQVNHEDTTYDENNLSSGAYNHLYYCCRLVVLRHLFPDKPGFMILDDPFLTYFPDRKEKAIQLLEDFIDDGWQILVFTVDPETRDLFSDHLSAETHSIKDLHAEVEGLER